MPARGIPSCGALYTTRTYALALVRRNMVGVLDGALRCEMVRCNNSLCAELAPRGVGLGLMI